ncbi:MAG: hypothetical protein WC762_14165 [Methylobacter sp.]|jgi:hypothetical protein
MKTTNTESQKNPAKENEDANPSQWMLWLVGIAVLGTGIALWMFWNNVYAYEGHVRDGFSIKPEDWGIFGSYVGGVLSPFFSFLALLALLWTINLQSRALKISNDALTVSKDELQLTRKELTKTAEAAQQQVEHFQEESKRTDLYRIIEKLVDRIDYNYQKVPVRDSFTFIDFVRKSSNILPGNLPALLILSKDETSQAFLTTRLIEKDLTHLLDYFKEYEKSSEVLRDFYRDEYKDLVNFLNDNDLLLDKEFAKTFI